MSTDPSLRAGILVDAIRRNATAAGAFATVMEKGDPDAGAVFVLRSWLDGRYRIFGQVRDGEGNPGWRSSKPGEYVDYQAVQEYISRQKGFDPDIWLVEIEDRSDALFLPGPLFD